MNFVSLFTRFFFAILPIALITIVLAGFNLIPVGFDGGYLRGYKAIIFLLFYWIFVVFFLSVIFYGMYHIGGWIKDKLMVAILAFRNIGKKANRSD